MSDSCTIPGGIGAKGSEDLAPIFARLLGIPLFLLNVVGSLLTLVIAALSLVVGFEVEGATSA